MYLESALPEEAKREFAARKTLPQSTPAPLPQVHPPPHVQFQLQKPSRAELRRERANAAATTSAHLLPQTAAEEQPPQEELQTQQLNDRQKARGPQAAQRAEEEMQLQLQPVVPRVPLTAENLLQMGGRLFLSEPDRVLVANDGSTPREVTSWRVLDAGESAAMVRTLLSRLNDARAALVASAAAQTQSLSEREHVNVNAAIAEGSPRPDGGAGGTFLHRQSHVHDTSGAHTRLPLARPASTPPEQPEQHTQLHQLLSPSTTAASSNVRVRDRRVASSADFGASSPHNDGTGPYVTGLIVVNGKPVDREWLLGPGGSSRDPRHRGCAQ